MSELKFKYLNEIDISDSLTDSAHVIVEDGGSIKRAPMNQLVTGGGVSSWNDLEDKPFGEEGTGATIEWDGSTEGRESALLNETTIYKVSDLVPSLDELKGCTATISAGGDPVEIPEEHIIVGEGCIVVAQLIVVVSATEYKLPGDNENVYSVPSVGTYAAIMQNKYIKSLTYGSTTIKPLDEKFIPDTIARSADVPEVNYPVTSVNGMTGDVVIEGGSGGGVSSWNDLTDKPFYEEGSGAVIEWDGNTEGLESAAAFTSLYKMSGATPTQAELTGGVLGAVDPDNNNEYIEVELTDEEFASVSDIECINCLFVGQFIVAYDTEISFMGTEYTLPSAGIWVMDIFRKLTYGSTTIHTLDEKFIPDTIARKSNVTWESLPDKPFGENQTVTEWDFNTEGLESVVGGSLTFYKMSDTIIDLNDYESIVVELKAPNGTTESSQVAEDNIIRDSGAIGQGQIVHTASGMQLHVVYMPSGGGTMQGVEFTGGQWIASSNADFSTAPSGASIKLTYGSTKTINPKFLPEGGFGWEEKSVELCAETEVAFSAQDGFYGGILDTAWDVAPGEKVIVGWDGTEYECVAIAQERFILLGNGSIMELEGNYGGEPFAIQIYPRIEVAFLTNDSSTYHSVRAYKDAQVHTIDPKFLPEATAVADAAGEAPTAAEFNALLAALRKAGYLAT